MRKRRRLARYHFEAEFAAKSKLGHVRQQSDVFGGDHQLQRALRGYHPREGETDQRTAKAAAEFAVTVAAAETATATTATASQDVPNVSGEVIFGPALAGHERWKVTIGFFTFVAPTGDKREGESGRLLAPAAAEPVAGAATEVAETTPAATATNSADCYEQ